MNKIAVMGGGPSGLYFSILAKKNFPSADVQVYEQNPKNATFGFGIILSAGGYGRFSDADTASSDALMAVSFPTQDRVMIVNGQRIEIKGGPVGYAIARIKLLNTLQDLAEQAGVNVHYETRIDNPDLLGADLVVGADGVNSVVRKSYEGEFGSSSWTLSNRMAWYGTTQHFDCPILSFKATEFGHFWTAAYPHQDDMSTFVAECDADAWVRSGLNKMNLEQRLKFAEKIFADELGGHPLLSNKSDWGSLPVIRTKHWSVGNRVLIGDALHSPHPSIGSGTRIAMEDAIALIEALVSIPDDIPAALAEFQRKHTAQTSKLVHAMEKSSLWYEDVGEKMDSMEPVSLVFDYMTRTGRLNEDRLKAEYPEFMTGYADEWSAWFAAQAHRFN
jgi:2-polyprenyl-6-methoxyphenol hydroxylase-like FAD-dependent oxidoreductase